MPEVGRKAPDKTHTQSVVFWKDAGWTEASSRDWCEEHDYYTDGLDENDDQFRWRQYDPESDKFDYRNQEIEADSISLVIGFPKSEEGNAEDIMARNYVIKDTAIAVHHTATDTESDWDGPAEVAACPAMAGPLRHMHAWQNADGDPDAKQSYKFPHHKAGTDTAANINGVNNALARLSQADIPDSDRAGVEAHLRAHREDAGLEDSADEEPEDALSAAAATRNRHRGLKQRERKAIHEPIRCFEGTARPHEPFWTWRNTLDGESEPEMDLYGYISEYSWFDDDVTPKMFKNDLYTFGGGGPITIRLNSYGGDVIAASVMKSILVDYPGLVTMKIDGIAASAATIVAIAGDRVLMQESGYFMIHDPMVAFFFAALNIEDLSRLLDALKTTKNGIVDSYITKTHLSRERLGRMMSDETWMTAGEAKELGFVDEVITANDKATKAQQTALQNAAVINALRNFVNLPEPLRKLRDVREPDIQRDIVPMDIIPEKLKAAERLRAEVKLYVKE